MTQTPQNPKPGTKAFYQLEAEKLQAELDRLRQTKIEEQVGLNVKVPRRLRDAARKLAHTRDVAMREVVTDALEHYLADKPDQ